MAVKANEAPCMYYSKKIEHTERRAQVQHIVPIRMRAHKPQIENPEALPDEIHAHRHPKIERQVADRSCDQQDIINCDSDVNCN